MEDGSEFNSTEVQRDLSTRILSKLVCGAQLSAQPAELLGSLLSHGSTSARLSKQLCGRCQWFDTPNSSQSNAFTAQESAALFNDTQFLFNKQALHL